MVKHYFGVCSARKRSTAYLAAAWCSGSFHFSIRVAFGAREAISREVDSEWCRSLPSNASNEHAARGDEQDRESRAVLFIVQPDTVTFEYRHIRHP
jgi:hypothetical protein